MNPGHSLRAFRQLLAASLAIALIGCTTGTTGTTAPSASPAGPPSTAPSVSSASPAATAVSLPAPELTKLTIGISVYDANTFTPQFAADQGLYEKYGLEAPETLVFGGGTRTVQALLAGQLHAARGGLEGVFLSQPTDVPLTFVASFYNRFLDDLVSSQEIATAEDLRGKRIGISVIGGFPHQETIAALESLGLTESDVELVEIGDEPERIAAMYAGSVDATIADASQRATFEAEGYHALVQISEIEGVELPLGSLIVQKSFAAENPNTVLAMVAANLEAAQLMYSDTDAAIDALATWAQLDRAAAEAKLNHFLTVQQRDLRWTPEGVVRYQTLQGIVSPDILGVDPTTTYTTEFLDKLEELGLYAELGVPGY